MSNPGNRCEDISSLRANELATELLSKLTVEEKIGQMLLLDARAGIEHPLLDLKAGGLLHVPPSEISRAQILATSSSGIPLLIGEDVIHGASFLPGATIFPTQLGMAATWNRELVKRAAQIAAAEASSVGVNWVFSPVLCVARDLRWGRVDETFGEDPYLVGELGSAAVEGYESSDSSGFIPLMATAKHFAGYSETQGGRDASESDLSRRKLISWFFPPFQKAAVCSVSSFMISYQGIDGVPASVNEWLIGDQLQNKWGYEGLIVTDWDNIGNLVRNQKVFSNIAEASAAAVNAGIEVVMSTPEFYQGAQRALEDGLIDISKIDCAVKKILLAKISLGLLDDNFRLKNEQAFSMNLSSETSAANRKINLDVARRSLVLLKNSILPLCPDKHLRIGLFGPLADNAQAQLGDWAGSSGQIDWMPDGHPRENIITVYDALKKWCPDNWITNFLDLGDVTTSIPDPRGEVMDDGQPRPCISAARSVGSVHMLEVAEVAKGSDVVIAVVGDTTDLAGESKSSATLELVGYQKDLLLTLSKTGTPLIVVMIASKPLILPKEINPQALIWAANPGMAGGKAIVEMFTGELNPSGRLPISFASHAGQLPVFYNQIRGQHGDRYVDLEQEPPYIFGEGLSYTEFAYSDLIIENPELNNSDILKAQVVIENIGSISGVETMQVYVRDNVSSTTWADKELKYFEQISIPSKEKVVVKFSIPVTEFTIVNSDLQRVVEPGSFELLVGHSSRDSDLLSADFRVV